LVYQTSQTVNALPFLAYQKIYYDFYSNSQWEKHKAYAYNVDYWSGAGNIGLVTDMVQLRYANYPKDYFMGMLPSSQYGSVAVLPSTISPLNSSNNVLAYSSGASPQFGLIENGSAVTNVTTSNSSDSIRYATLNSDLSALSIRATEYLQRWKEVVQFSSKDYSNQMAQAVKTSAETNGIRISNRIAESTADSLIYANIQSNRARGISSFWDAESNNVLKNLELSKVNHFYPNSEQHILGN
jgi:ketol-acid reductoisomerase